MMKVMTPTALGHGWRLKGKHATLIYKHFTPLTTCRQQVKVASAERPLVAETDNLPGSHMNVPVEVSAY